MPHISCELQLAAVPFAIRYSRIHAWYWSKGQETEWAVLAGLKKAENDHDDPLGTEVRGMMESIAKRLKANRR
jgi:hypothetical protein